MFDDRDLWVRFWVTVLLSIGSQPRMKGNGGLYDGFCLCGGVGMDDCFGGSTDFVR